MEQRAFVQKVGIPLWALTLALLWFGLSTANAKAQEVDRGLNLEGTDAVYAADIAIDDDDNLYIAGDLWGYTEFGSVLIGSAGFNDVYIAKYDPQGNNLWGHRIGGDQYDSAASIAVDSDGNSYVLGNFQGTVSVGPTILTNPDGFDDIFIVKYNTDGNFLWAKQIDGGTSHMVSSSASVDSSGNLYITAAFGDIADFGSETLTTTGGVDSFLAKFDGNSNLLWARQVSGSNDQRLFGVATANGKVYVAGLYQYVVSFGIGTTVSRGNEDGCLAAFASDGTLLWVTSMGGEGQDAAYDVTVDDDGNIFTTGSFAGNANFGLLTATSVGPSDGFVMKNAPDSAPLWVRAFGGETAARGESLATDNDNNVYITGPLGQGQARFGAIEIAAEENSSFIARYDSSGNANWVRQPTSPIFVGTDAIAVDSNGYLYAAGGYQISVYLGSFTITTTGYPQAAFLARWSPTPANDLIFADGFEQGNFAAWTNYSSDQGDLAVTTRAALAGRRGLQALLDDTVSIGMRDELPASEEHYLSRFQIDPNSLSMAQDENHVVFFGYSGNDLRRPVLRLELRRHDDWYQLRAALLDDGFTWRTSTWKVIGDEPTRVSLEWYAATGDGANNGSLLLRLNDHISSLLTGVDNDTRRIDTIRWGAIAGIDNGTRGTYYLDAFESRRLTYVDPDVMLATALPDELTAWTDIDESDPEEAALMQEVMEYAEQVKQEGEEEIPPTEEDQIPQLFLPYLNRQ